MVRLALCLLLLTAATTALAAPRKSGIIVIDSQADTSGCARIGPVQAVSPWGGALSDVAYGRALSALKKKTRGLGGTHLQVVDRSSTTSGTTLLGEALRCLPPAAADAGR